MDWTGCVVCGLAASHDWLYCVWIDYTANGWPYCSWTGCTVCELAVSHVDWLYCMWISCIACGLTVLCVAGLNCMWMGCTACESAGGRNTTASVSSDCIMSARREQRREQYRHVREHVREDGIRHTCGWSVPSRFKQVPPRDTSMPPPVDPP